MNDQEYLIHLHAVHGHIEICGTKEIRPAPEEDFKTQSAGALNYEVAVKNKMMPLG
jgi:hypothetical protein